jgi:type I restriction enzyme, S subunit
LNSGRIDDIASAIIDYRGRTPPKSPDGIKLLTAKVIKDGTIDDSRLEYISEETYAWWMRRGFPRQYDILLTTEAPLGEVALLRSAEPIALAQRVILLRGDPAVVDQKYLFAALRSPLLQDRLRQRATGTTVLGIKQRELRQVEVPLPSLPTQRKIAAILSAYDDLIENNNRRIKLLEEMAQRIYREWFVDFRYPGHEDVPLVDSELGPIPEGWHTGTLRDLAQVNANTIGKVRNEEEIRYIDITSVTRGVVDQPKQMVMGEAPGRARRRVADGDIIWSTVRPNLRAYALLLSPGGDCVASTGFAVLSPCAASFAYVYALTTTDEFVEYLIGRATGAAYPAVTPPVFQSAPAVIPPPDVLRAYADVGEPLMRLASKLGFQVLNLRKTRDLLLPYLISGEVDVADLSIAVSEAVA